MKLLAYILTPVFLMLCLLTIIGLDIPLRLTRRPFPGLHKHLLDLSSGLVIFYLRLLGTRIYIRWNFQLPSEHSIIFVSNHQSLFDIPLLMSVLRDFSPKFVAKKELGRGIPSISYVLRTNGSALIDRSQPLQALAEIEKMAKFIRDSKQSVCIFPEGTRSRDGNLKYFKSSGLEKILEQAPSALVVPVCISNSWRLTEFGFWPIPLGVRIDIGILDPVARENKDIEQFTQSLRSKIDTHLTELKATATDF